MATKTEKAAPKAAKTTKTADKEAPAKAAPAKAAKPAATKAAAGAKSIVENLKSMLNKPKAQAA